MQQQPQHGLWQAEGAACCDSSSSNSSTKLLSGEMLLPSITTAHMALGKLKEEGLL